jgi:hypothetical protein
METKYFVGKDSEGIFAVYKAQFEGKILKSEQAWSLLGGAKWKPTDQVSQWYFVGNDTVYPVSEAEAAKYLPAGAI